MSLAGNLPVAGQSLALTPSLRAGLKAITVLAFISFFAATTLCLYLGYKLVWYMYIKPARKAHDAVSSQQSLKGEQQPKSFQQAVDFALGIEGIFDEQAQNDSHGNGNGKKPVVTTTDDVRRGSKSALSSADAPRKQKNPPNQFLLLIFNLLLADMHQATAFFLNVEWLWRDEIKVDTGTCFAQGLFISTGDLASSCFITAIAVHTYLSVVRRYRPSHRLLTCVIIGIWAFVYLISTLPIAATRNGAEVGGFFVRAGTWVSFSSTVNSRSHT
jgi:hypothetical protein